MAQTESSISATAADNAVAAEQYNQVVRLAQLAQVMLMRSQFEISGSWFDPGIERDLECTLTGSQVHNIPDTGRAVGEFDWEVSAVDKEGKSLLKINASFAAIYEGLDGQNDEAVSGFIARVGQFAVYPYLRTFVGQMSWLSCANLPILPVLRQIT